MILCDYGHCGYCEICLVAMGGYGAKAAYYNML